MASTYMFVSHCIKSTDEKFPSYLAAAYTKGIRPQCMCKSPGVDMYISKVGSLHVIKRMPNTGGNHDVSCESYEPPAELSGLSQVSGTAIAEDTASGITTLKFDFSLSKTGNKPPQSSASGDSSSVKTDGTKLTILSTLHYLWEEAGLNRWVPNMANKRSWAVVRNNLLKAVEGKQAKGNQLSSVLFIPETWSTERKTELAAYRESVFQKVSSIEKGARKLMILIAEFKSVEAGRQGFVLKVKHMPDFSFNMPDDLVNRFNKRFYAELLLSNADDSGHPIVIATFSVSGAGGASIEEISIMLVDNDWLPYESSIEHVLLQSMKNRRFTKGLRYNLSKRSPLASLIATDTGDKPTPLYIIPSSADDDYRSRLNELIDNSSLAQAWIWDAATGEMPPLPSPN